VFVDQSAYPTVADQREIERAHFLVAGQGIPQRKVQIIGEP
jgi:hypothetical protein